MRAFRFVWDAAWLLYASVAVVRCLLTDVQPLLRFIDRKLGRDHRCE